MADYLSGAAMVFTGVVLRQVQAVTLQGGHGIAWSGWIPVGVARRPGDLVRIAGHSYTVLTLDPPIDQPTNRHRYWRHATRWIDPADQT